MVNINAGGSTDTSTDTETDSSTGLSDAQMARIKRSIRRDRDTAADDSVSTGSGSSGGSRSDRTRSARQAVSRDPGRDTSSGSSGGGSRSDPARSAREAVSRDPGRDSSSGSSGGASAGGGSGSGSGGSSPSVGGSDPPDSTRTTDPSTAIEPVRRNQDSIRGPSVRSPTTPDADSGRNGLTDREQRRATAAIAREVQSVRDAQQGIERDTGSIGQQAARLERDVLEANPNLGSEDVAIRREGDTLRAEVNALGAQTFADRRAALRDQQRQTAIAEQGAAEAVREDPGFQASLAAAEREFQRETTAVIGRQAEAVSRDPGRTFESLFTAQSQDQQRAANERVLSGLAAKTILKEREERSTEDRVRPWERGGAFDLPGRFGQVQDDAQRVYADTISATGEAVEDELESGLPIAFSRSGGGGGVRIEGVSKGLKTSFERSRDSARRAVLTGAGDLAASAKIDPRSVAAAGAAAVAFPEPTTSVGGAALLGSAAAGAAIADTARRANEDDFSGVELPVGGISTQNIQRLDRSEIPATGEGLPSQEIPLEERRRREIPISSPQQSEISIEDVIDQDRAEIQVPEQFDRSEFTIRDDGTIDAPIEFSGNVLIRQEGDEVEDDAQEDDLIVNVPEEFIPDGTVVIGGETGASEQVEPELDREQEPTETTIQDGFAERLEDTEETLDGEQETTDLLDRAQEIELLQQVEEQLSGSEVGGDLPDPVAVGLEQEQSQSFDLQSLQDVRLDSNQGPRIGSLPAESLVPDSLTTSQQANAQVLADPTLPGTRLSLSLSSVTPTEQQFPEQFGETNADLPGFGTGQATAPGVPERLPRADFEPTDEPSFDFDILEEDDIFDTGFASGDELDSLLSGDSLPDDPL